MLVVLLGAGVARILAGESQADVKSEVVAFTGVNVLPMTSETVLSNQTVVVERGKIKSIGPAGQSPIPAGAVVVGNPASIIKKVDQLTCSKGFYDKPYGWPPYTGSETAER